jgi:hypothetical protein
MADMPAGAESALVGVEPPSASAQERKASSPLGGAAGRMPDLGRARSLPKALGSGDAQVDWRGAEHLVPSTTPVGRVQGDIARGSCHLSCHALARPMPGKSACIAAATLWA